jgi:hypothetical protein
MYGGGGIGDDKGKTWRVSRMESVNIGTWLETSFDLSPRRSVMATAVSGQTGFVVVSQVKGLMS